MSKKIGFLMLVVFMMVSSSVLVNSRSIYDIWNGGSVALNDIVIDGTLNWRIVFATLGANSSANNPQLTVSSTAISLSALASWYDWPNGPCSCGTCSSGYFIDLVSGCGGWHYVYYPYHLYGQDLTSVQTVNAGTYTFNMKSYGDGLINSEFNNISGYNCNWFCTQSVPYPGNPTCVHGGYNWYAVTNKCDYSTPTSCTEYDSNYGRHCNGVYAKIEFFDDANLEGTIESNNWPVTGGSGGTKQTYSDYGVTWITDSSPGALVEVQQDITVQLVCSDEDSCISATSGCSTPTQKYQCILQADGCYDNVTTDCSGSCVAGVCVAPSYTDCGLRIYNGTDILHIACAQEGAYSMKIKGSDGNIYSIPLVPLSNPSASNVRVYNGTATVAMMKYNPLPAALSEWKFDEGDGKIAFDSVGSNDGIHYGNTQLLMRFNDTPAKPKDESPYSNDGAYYGNTLLLMRFNESSGNPKDESGYGNDGTLGGQATYAAGYSGNAMSFDGSGDYVNVGDMDSIDLEPEFTYCSWLYHSSDTTDDAIFAKTTSNTDGIVFWRDDVTGTSGRTDTYTVNLMEAGTTDTVRIEGATNAGTAGSWRFVCFTVDLGSSTGLRLYINGVEDANSPVSISSITNIDTSTNAANIGRWAYSSAYDYHGLIDEAVIYSKVLTQTEIYNLYLEGKAKFLDGDWVDGKSGKALHFDGLYDYVVLPKPLIGNNQSFTISAWVNASYVGYTQRIYMEGNTTSDYPYYSLQINESGAPYLYARGRTSNRIYILSSDNINWGQWHQVVGVRNASNNGALYIDGNEVSGYNPSSDRTGPDSGNFNLNTIGALRRSTSLTGTDFFNGAIDELAVYSRPLSATQIQEQYNLGKATFTDWVDGKSGKALRFDGVDDSVSITNPAVSFTEGSISLWANFSSNSFIGGMVATGHGSGQAEFFGIVVYNGYIRADFDDGDDGCARKSVQSSVTYGDGQWHNYVITFSAQGTGRLYIDGVEEGTGVSLSGCEPQYNPTEDWTIGSYSTSYYYEGVIDDVIVYDKSLTSTEVSTLYNSYG
jgi:hypothetical protein